MLRNSSTGKIVIVGAHSIFPVHTTDVHLLQNFNIYAGMNPVISKNVVSFVGHDHSDVAVTRGSATPFKLRVKTELLANDLKDALDKAIEALPSKSD